VSQETFGNQRQWFAMSISLAHVCGSKVTPLEYTVLQPPRAYCPANRGHIVVYGQKGKDTDRALAIHKGGWIGGLLLRTSARHGSPCRLTLDVREPSKLDFTIAVPCAKLPDEGEEANVDPFQRNHSRRLNPGLRSRLRNAVNPADRGRTL
jgi:hypothetical protein